MRNLFLFSEQQIPMVNFCPCFADNYAMATEKRYNGILPYRQ